MVFMILAAHLRTGLATDSSFLSKKGMEEMMQLVFGGWSMEKLQSPQYSPLYADLHNLPPALFTVGAADPLADDILFYGSKMAHGR